MFSPNLLIFKTLRGGGKLLLLVALTCTLFMACTSKNPKSANRLSTDNLPVDVRASVVYNPDSLLHYARLAYLEDDPQGLFITGAAAYLRAQDPDFPDSCTTVPLWEASIMLKHASDLGHSDAARLIRCLQEGGCWEEGTVPNDK